APGAIVVQAGTLKAGDSGFSSLFNSSVTTVKAGATIDLAGFSAAMSLPGGGTLTDSGAATTLTLHRVHCAGKIAGPPSVAITGTTHLTGTNTYTGSTTIGAGVLVFLGDGGTTGSIAAAGSISNGGSLVIDRSNAVTLGNTISGVGQLGQIGAGTTTLTAANSYSGGTVLDAGTLAIGNAGALGTGTLRDQGNAQLLG